jgi:hypothetical protein
VKFKVWCPDTGGTEDDARSVEAISATGAAEEWAAEDDWRSAEYAIVGGTPAVVMVRAPDGQLTEWRVEGQALPSYVAYHRRTLEPAR